MLDILLLIVGVINIFVIFTLLLALKNYLLKYKNAIDNQSVRQELSIVKDELSKKIEDLKPLLSFKESCFLGIGGGGGNIISHIKEIDAKHKFIYINSDLQALSVKKSNHKILLQKETNDNLGCGGQVRCAQRLFDDRAKKRVKKMIKGYNDIYIIASLGGGLGSGATPDVVRFLQDIGKNVYLSVTLPFEYEGKKRKDVANSALEELQSIVKHINVFDNNEVLKEITDEGIDATFKKISKNIYLDLLDNR